MELKAEYSVSHVGETHGVMFGSVLNQCEIAFKNGMNKRGKFESSCVKNRRNFIEINIIKAEYIQKIQDSKHIA